MRLAMEAQALPQKGVNALWYMDGNDKLKPYVTAITIVKTGSQLRWLLVTEVIHSKQEATLVKQKHV